MSQTGYNLVMIVVETQDDEVDALSRSDVANALDPRLMGMRIMGEWDIAGVKTVQLDVDTLASLIEDAELTGEQTVELMGQITARSIGKSLVEMGRKLIAEGSADAAP